MHRGYVKMWRKIQDTSFYKNSKCVHLAVHLLLECNHKPEKFIFNGEEVICDRGQKITGIDKLHSQTGISIQSIRTALKTLVNVGFLTIKPTNRYSLISIANYDQYQDETNKQTNKQLTNNQQTSNKQITTNNNDKNEKNDKKEEYCEHFNLFWEAYPKKVGKDTAYELWGKLHPHIEDCLTALKWQKESVDWTKDNGKYIPSPTNWLKGGRWKDEPTKQPNSPKKGKYDHLINVVGEE